MAQDKNPLTPRETAMRMLEHMHEDVSYEDIIRQLRVLQDIENTLNDVELGGFPADDAVEAARSELDGSTTSGRADPPDSSVVLASGGDGGGRRAESGTGEGDGVSFPRALRRPPDEALLRKARWVR